MTEREKIEKRIADRAKRRKELEAKRDGGNLSPSPTPPPMSSPEPADTPPPISTSEPKPTPPPASTVETPKEEQPLDRRTVLMRKLPVLNEQHPDIKNVDRTQIKSLLSYPGEYGRALRKKYPDHDIDVIDGSVVMKKRDENEWRKLDPSGFKGFTELVRDTRDLSYDIGSSIPNIGKRIAGALGGSVPGYMAAGAASEAAIETGRQTAAKSLGLRDEYDPGEIKRAAVYGSIIPGGHRVVKGVSKLGPVKALGSFIADIFRPATSQSKRALGKVADATNIDERTLRDFTTDYLQSYPKANKPEQQVLKEVREIFRKDWKLGKASFKIANRDPEVARNNLKLARQILEKEMEIESTKQLGTTTVSKKLRELNRQHKMLSTVEDRYTKHIEDVLTPRSGPSDTPRGLSEMVVRKGMDIIHDPQRALAKPDLVEKFYNLTGAGFQKTGPTLTRLAEREARRSFTDPKKNKAKFSVGSLDYKRLQKYLEEKDLLKKSK